MHKVSDLCTKEKIMVETKRLDTIMEEHQIGDVHYLKIDTEGNDLNVFKSLGRFFDHIWCFEMEVWNDKRESLFKGANDSDECLDFVKGKNFSLVEKFFHGKDRVSDLLFVNNRIRKAQ